MAVKQLTNQQQQWLDIQVTPAAPVGVTSQTMSSIINDLYNFGGAITKYTPTLSPAAVAANTTAEQTFTVTGLAVGDIAIRPNKPTAQAGLGIVGVRVSAANTLAITFSNNTASPITPTASEVYSFVAFRM